MIAFDIAKSDKRNIKSTSYMSIGNDILTIQISEE